MVPFVELLIQHWRCHWHFSHIWILIRCVLYTLRDLQEPILRIKHILFHLETLS